jgi:hypothetical protein
MAHALAGFMDGAALRQLDGLQVRLKLSILRREQRREQVILGRRLRSG